MVRQAGLEPATYGLEVRCSIQLSYWRKQDVYISKTTNLSTKKKFYCKKNFLIEFYPHLVYDDTNCASAH